MSARPSRHRAFTLVELLVSMAILSMLVLILLSITDATRKTWSYTNAKIEQFRDAREAFETITRRLSQATLNTYWDYHYPNNDTEKAPDGYVRQSELRFISGPNLVEGSPSHSIFFQAPLGESDSYSGMKNLLNTCGYFVEFGSDKDSRPSFVKSPERWRFRLMELIEPTESLSLYKYTSGRENDAADGEAKNISYKGKEWFTDPLADAKNKRAVADNILALVLLPKLANGEKRASDSGGELRPFEPHELAPNYTCDSTEESDDPALNPKNQLPPVVRVTMVAVDETSFNRLQGSGTTAPTLLGKYFTDSSKFDEDLKGLEADLVKKKLNYRIFTTDVTLKAGKWSREQKKMAQ